MIVRRTVAFGIASVIFFVGGMAHAATITSIQGGVLVSTGGGYVTVKGPTPLKTGNSVIANPGSSAQVVYEGGCTVPVQAGSVVVVEAKPPCPKTAATGAAAPGAATGSTGDASAAALGGNVLVLGGLAIAGGVAAGVAIGSSGSGKDKPASP